MRLQPSLSFTLSFNSALPALGCHRSDSHAKLNSDDVTILLSEVKLCFDKNLMMIDCSEADKFGGCEPNKPVNYYPKKTHRRAKLETTISKT